ncbi:MAG: isocitrate lyase/phosphoenolpyruvate mutase family protein [Pseudomonadales bacterium]
MTSQSEKCDQFAALHSQADAFIIPNPWDAGSAKILQELGFKALATTSAGFAYSLGRTDGKPTLEEKLAHCRTLASATDIPVNADFEDGFADDPETVATNVLRLLETGVAGGSIEDFSRSTRTLFGRNQAVERLQAAAEAIENSGLAFQLTARAENLLRGVNDLDDTIQRLLAYQAAGAHVLYAPGIRTLKDLRTVTGSIQRPFNVLGVFMPDASLQDFSAAGAKRVSVGGALTWAAVKPLLDAGREMLDQGTFGWIRNTAPGAEVNRLLQSDVQR